MTAANVRRFSAGQVMTVLVGSADRPFCTWGQLLDVLGWLLQDVPAHDRVDAAIDYCRSSVQAKHPDLVGVQAPPAGASDAHLLGWLADIEERFGGPDRSFELAPIVDAATAPPEEAEPDV